ncbi:MAG: tRNA (mnm(5)s(2)U34)-methyltransferase [Pirellula sp.]
MHFTLEAQSRCRPWITQSSIAIDATAGNGFDTLFLAQRVGPLGHVYAFDLQADAIARTSQRVADAGFSARVTCIQADHANLAEHIPKEHYGRVSCAMLNLGYLPHSDKSIVTKSHSTIRALDALEAMLSSNSMLSILAYVGHPDGLQESLAVETWIDQRTELFTSERLFDQNNPASPILWLLRRGP